MEIIGITLSEGNPGHYIIYTNDGQEIEYTKIYIETKLTKYKFNKLIR